MKRLVYVFLTAVVAACNGAGFSADKAVTPSKTRASSAPNKVVFVGNSLTLHVESVELGWPNHWGMAASAQRNDYAHLTGFALGFPVTVINMAGLETDTPAHLVRLPEIARSIDRDTFVVVQLGDNVQATALNDFKPAYGRLLDTVGGSARLACVSTWWRNAAADALIREQCTLRGGRYVYIGDIHTDPASQDGRGPRFAIEAVNAHPHDWGMARIAQRLVEALR